jgi:cell shape-determining protein MreC
MYSSNMTTISNSRRKKRPTLRSILFLGLVIISAGAAFFWRDALASVLWRAAAPLMSAREQGADAAGVFFSQFGSNAELAAENMRLKAELASASILLMDREILRAENADLKLRLGRVGETPPVLAAVLLRPPGVPYDTLVIDAGKAEGIGEGDLVAAGGSVYVGRVAGVYAHSSRVVLFSSPEQTHEVLLRGTIPLTLKGQGGGSITGELPVGTEVAIGDTVLLSGIAPQFAAKVTSVVRREGESFQSVYLTLPVNPFELRFVEVHKKFDVTQ